MLIASFVFASFMIAVLAIDRIFMPKKARKAWTFMAVTYGFAVVFTLFPESLSQVAKVLGIGRGVDVVLYFVSIIVVREVFLNRSRQSSLERQVTCLARELALSNARLINPEPGSKVIEE
jgi:hypothetical protein